MSRFFSFFKRARCTKRSSGLIAAAFVAFGSALGHAQVQSTDRVLSSFELRRPSVETLRALSFFFALEGHVGDSYEIVVPEKQSDLLRALAPQARLIASDASAAGRERVRSFGSSRLSEGERYHSFDQVQDWITKVASEHTDFAQAISYGTSAGARPLRALHLSAAGSGKPVMMITAATHGDELITTEVLIRLIDKLVAAYRKEPRLTQILETHDLYFIPVVNPDGFADVRRYDGDIDPNRSYPYPENPGVTPSPSIAEIIRFFHEIKPVATLDYHAYGELVMYPWAYTHEKISEPFRAKFDAVASRMAEQNHYTFGPIADTIYVAPASSCDYYFWKSSSASFAIEIGTRKIPAPATIPVYVESQEESLWRFIEAF